MTEVLSTLETVVGEKPDYVYTDNLGRSADVDSGVTCKYVHTDPHTGERTPGCVVGHVLYRLGVDLDTLGSAACEGRRAELIVRQFVRNPWATDDVSETLRLLGRVQYAQDCGKPWGEALADAKASRGAE